MTRDATRQAMSTGFEMRKIIIGALMTFTAVNAMAGWLEGVQGQPARETLNAEMWKLSLESAPQVAAIDFGDISKYGIAGISIGSSILYADDRNRNAFPSYHRDDPEPAPDATLTANCRVSRYGNYALYNMVYQHNSLIFDCVTTVFGIGGVDVFAVGFKSVDIKNAVPSDASSAKKSAFLSSIGKILKGAQGSSSQTQETVPTPYRVFELSAAAKNANNELVAQAAVKKWGEPTFHKVFDLRIPDQYCSYEIVQTDATPAQLKKCIETVQTVANGASTHGLSGMAGAFLSVSMLSIVEVYKFNSNPDFTVSLELTKDVTNSRNPVDSIGLETRLKLTVQSTKEGSFDQAQAAALNRVREQYDPEISKDRDADKF